MKKPRNVIGRSRSTSKCEKKSGRKYVINIVDTKIEEQHVFGWIKTPGGADFTDPLFAQNQET